MDLGFLKTIILLQLLLNIFTCANGFPSRARPRLSIVDWANYNAFEPQGKGTYAFGYDVEDPETNNIQYRDEERHSNGTVTGSYGYLRPDGNVQIVHYVADDKGYRVKIETNPRGQLKKPLDNDNLFPQESYMSPALASALRSKQVYKKQRVHERRTRPIDMSHASIRNSRSYPTTSYHNLNEDYKFDSYSSEFHEPSGFDRSFFSDSDNSDSPFYKFFGNRS